MSDYPIIGQKSSFNNYEGDMGWESILGGNKKEDMDLMQLYTHAYSNVRLVARAASRINPKFVRVSNNDTEVTEHWLKVALESTLRHSSTNKFWESVYSYSLVSDNSYILFHYNQKNALRFPHTADVVLPTSISLNKTKDNEFSGYLMQQGNQKVKLQEKQIIHIADWSPLSKLGGFSPLKALSNYLNIEQLITMYQAGFFENSAIPSGAFVIEADKASFDNAVSQIRKKHMGKGNNHAIQFIRKEPRKEQSVKFEKFQQDNNTLEMSSLFARIDKRIDDAFGIPKEMKGDITSTNLAGVKMAERIFMSNVVLPKVLSVYDSINFWLRKNFPNEDIMIIPDYEAPELSENLESDARIKKICAETAAILKGTGATLESIREVTGLENLVLEDTPAPATTAQRNVSVITIEPTGNKNADIEPAPKEDEAKLLSVPQMEQEESKIYSDFLEFLRGQEKRVLRLLNKKDIDDIDNLDVEEETKLLRELALPAFFALIERSSRKSRRAGLREAGINTDTILADLIPSNFRRAINVRMDSVFRSFNQNSVLELRSIQNEATRNGWSKSQLRTEITNYYQKQGEYINQAGRTIKNNARYRADRLVRTETNRSNNAAAVEQRQIIANEAGVQYKKVWRRRGTRPEPICDALEGRVVGLSEPFIKNGEQLKSDTGEVVTTHNYFDALVPPEHPNCLCYIEFEVIR